MFMLIR